jgi:hypothetical protein
MKAIPMRGRLLGKKPAGYIWAGPGENYKKKEKYFQLKDNRLVTAVLASSSGSFWVRCKGANFEISCRGTNRKILGTTILVLPHGKNDSVGA